VTLEEVEEALRQRLMALPPAARAELLHVMTLPDFERAEPSGSASSGATRRAGPSPSFWSTVRRTGPSGRCSSGCCGRWSGS